MSTKFVHVKIDHVNFFSLLCHVALTMPAPSYGNFAFSVSPVPDAQDSTNSPPFFAAFTADGTLLPEPRHQRQHASSIPWNCRGASQFWQTDPTSFHVSPPSQRHPSTMGHRSGVESAFGANRASIQAFQSPSVH